MGRKVWTRERLTSADVQSFLMDQAVIRFPSAATRTADWPSPPDGALSYLEDAKRYDEHRDGAWRPFLSGGIAGKMWRTAGVQSTGGALATQYVPGMDASRVRGGVTFDDAGDSLVLPSDGLYDLTWQMYVLGNMSSTGTMGVRRARTSVANLIVAQKSFHKPLAAVDLQEQAFARDIPLKAGDKLALTLTFEAGAGVQMFGNGEVNGCQLSAVWRAPLPAGTTPL